MTTALALTADRCPDGTTVLAAVGEIDMSNVDAFATALDQAAGAREDGRPLVVDLTAVEYLDSAGLAVLFSHVEHVRLIAGPLLAPLLTISGLADLTTVRM